MEVLLQDSNLTHLILIFKFQYFNFFIGHEHSWGRWSNEYKYKKKPQEKKWILNQNDLHFNLKDYKV